jgi:hypothetical protein
MAYKVGEKNYELQRLICDNYGTQSGFSAKLGDVKKKNPIVSMVTRNKRVLSSVEVREWAKLLGVSQKELKIILEGI